MRSFQLPIKFIGVLRWCRYTHYKCRNQFSSIQKWWLLGLPKNTRCKNHWYKICIYDPSTPLAPTKHRFVFEEDEKVARVYKTKQNYCRHWKLLLYICLNIQDNILTYITQTILCYTNFLISISFLICLRFIATENEWSMKMVFKGSITESNNPIYIYIYISLQYNYSS